VNATRGRACAETGRHSAPPASRTPAPRSSVPRSTDISANFREGYRLTSDVNAGRSAPPTFPIFMGKWVPVKTTVEIPDALFRKAKATAAERGVPLKDLLTEAVREHLHRAAGDSSMDKPSAPSWMAAFGGLQNLHKETKRINRVLEREFGQIEEDEWR